LPVASILDTLGKQGGVDILAPKGLLLFDVPLPSDDFDGSLEVVASNSRSTVDQGDTEEQEMDREVRVEVEDVLADFAAGQGSYTSSMKSSLGSVERTIQLDGKGISKARVLAMYSKYRKIASSTDRLKRVQEVARFTADHATSQEMTGGPLHLSAALVVHDLIAAIISCEGRSWLCLGEVNGLKLNGQSMPHLNHSVLCDEAVVFCSSFLDSDLQQRHIIRTQDQTTTLTGELTTPPSDHLIFLAGLSRC
jgi:hypothetical protein